MRNSVFAMVEMIEKAIGVSMKKVDEVAFFMTVRKSVVRIVWVHTRAA